MNKQSFAALLASILLSGLKAPIIANSEEIHEALSTAKRIMKLSERDKELSGPWGEEEIE